MWPFNKRTSLPGYSRDMKGSLVFELTDEEKQEVQKQFDLFKRPGGEFIVKKEIAEELQRGTIAQGLFNYAKDQIMLSGFDSKKNEKNEIINKAISSISKAFSFCPLPIYMYDLACFMEMNEKYTEAKGVFRNFLELQKKFVPTEIQRILLDSQSRNIDSAINHAEQQIKGAV